VRKPLAVSVVRKKLKRRKDKNVLFDIIKMWSANCIKNQKKVIK
jgi:hypothetical protein